MTKYIYNLDNRELSLHELIGNIFELLVNSAKKHSKQRSYGKNMLKLKIWNDESDTPLAANREAYKA